jgi:hypothetical protein
MTELQSGQYLDVARKLSKKFTLISELLFDIETILEENDIDDLKYRIDEYDSISTILSSLHRTNDRAQEMLVEKTKKVIIKKGA